MEKQVCPICGKGSLKKEIIQEEFKYKGRSQIIPDYCIYKCNNCNEEIVDKESLKRSGKILKNFKREVDSLLTSEDIKKIRKRFGYTQRQMAEFLGGGEKSFARYESGAICQSRAMDNLLRILDRFPHIVSFLSKGQAYPGETKIIDFSGETKIIDFSTYLFSTESKDFSNYIEGSKYGV